MSGLPPSVVGVVVDDVAAVAVALFVCDVFPPFVVRYISMVCVLGVLH